MKKPKEPEGPKGPCMMCPGTGTLDRVQMIGRQRHRFYICPRCRKKRDKELERRAWA